MKTELQIRLIALDKLLEKSLYFWTEHIKTLRQRHYLEAEMWEKKHASNERLTMKVLDKILSKEGLWR